MVPILMPASVPEFLSANRDYLLFSTVSLVVLVLLNLGLRRFRRGAQLRWPIWGAAAAVLVGGWWFTRNADDEARAGIIRAVNILAPTYAMEFERMGHAGINLETKADDPHYLELIEATKSWQQVNPFAHDIYTIRQLPDGRRVFIVDPETDYNHDGKYEGERESRTAIGEVFDKEDAGLDLALAGHAKFNDTVIEDRWGRWVGSWAPIYANGKVEAVVGVDYDADQWAAVIAAARQGAIHRLALMLFAVAVAGTAFALQREDLVRRAEIEARSRQAEERMLLTVRKLPLGFIEWNARAEVVAWNPSAERIFGFNRDEMLGKAVFPLVVAPGSRDHVDKIWASLIKQAGGTHSINDNLTKDGRTIICEWFNTPLVGADGKVSGVFSLMQDITERVNLEKHVQQSQRLGAVGQLAAGVAHDFNNILTIITGHAGLLLGQDNLPSNARPELERIEEAAVRAASLTRQLLAFSRQQAMFPRPLHLNDVVKSAATMLARVLGDDVSLNVQLDDPSMVIEGDPAMLDQVITNLVLNSRDAMPRGGSITIAVDRVDISVDAARLDPDANPGPAVRLAVSDTGIGIPSEHLQRIFEPFYTTKQTGKGTGLGLSVVHGIVKQHHGWVEVRSSPGRGTTFHLYFPPTDKKPDGGPLRRPTHEQPSLSHPRATILVVEDEAIVRELARMILERAGYHVIEAEDGPTALRLWSERGKEVDLLLTDMVMPNGITGRELSLRLLNERPNLPVIYASGYSMELTAPDFQPNERQIFLQKPYLTDQLVAMVRRCLPGRIGLNGKS
jgi:PAS domain S-box-containing protein